MKKLTTISLFIFWAITVAVITAGLISHNQNSPLAATLNTNGTNQAGASITGINPNVDLVLSTAELAKHNSAQSCWLLISGKIYDVTTFLPNHPGEAKAILPNCGTDATVAFTTKGGTGSHSSSATAMLAAYYIGNLDQTVTTSPTNPTNPPIANPNPIIPPRSGDDDD